MKKTILFTIVVLCCMSNAYAVVTWNGTTKTAWTQGTGTEADPFIISSPNHLAYLAQQVNAGNTYEGVYFRQTQDFDMKSKNWTPIGNETYPFAGIYDGGNKYISNLHIITWKGGIFGQTRNSTISNVVIQGAVTTPKNSNAYNFYSQYVVGLVGIAEGTTIIKNCHNKASILSKNFPFDALNYAGLVYKATGNSILISNCSNEGEIGFSAKPGSSGSNGNGYAAGLICISNVPTRIERSYNKGTCKAAAGTGTYNGSAVACCAGLIAYIDNSLTIYECFNDAAAPACFSFSSNSNSTFYHRLGGLIGLISENSNVTIAKCYSKGQKFKTVDNSRLCAHSFIGRNQGQCSIIGSYSRDTLTTTYPDNDYLIFGGAQIQCCYHASQKNTCRLGAAGVEDSYMTSFAEGTVFGEYKSETTFKSERILPLLNTLDEYFTMDYEGINDGYPILKWQAGTRYNISATCDANRGSVIGGGEYPNGYTATLTATPKSGCTFVGWSDGNTDNPRTVTVSGDAAYIAQFAKSSYIIYVNQDCTGNIE